MTLVIICGKCGRGIIGAESQRALVDSMPTWWMAHPTEPGKMLEGPRCDGRLLRVDRMSQIEKIYHEPILKPGDVHILEDD